ncbi:MAG: ABC transporter ATP-binding protein [Thermomicrobiales bacterium]
MEHADADRTPQPSGQDAAFEVRDLSATFVEKGVTLEALRSVTFSVRDGEFVAVIGPSGCGKSTLLDIVAGLLRPARGDVILGGQRSSASDRLGRSAYMRQRDLLLPWRDVLDNAAIPLEIAGMTKRSARGEVRARLAAFGLAGFEHAHPAQLSGGMRQRVAFLRTLLAGRSLLLLDEPFGALDALTRVQMQDFLVALLAEERKTALLVTHDVEEAIFLADRVVVLSARPGQVTAIVDVGLPRPRERVLVTTAEFVRLKSEILSHLGFLAPLPGRQSA